MRTLFSKNWLVISLSLVASGCAGGAIHVEEREGECILSGGLFTPTILEQAPPETDVEYRFSYEGDRCNVEVSGPQE